MDKNKSLKLRKKRVRSKISGTSRKPRLSIRRSNKNLYVQLVNDDKEETIIGMNSNSLSKDKVKGKTKKEIAQVLGEEFAAACKAKKVKSIVFDRSGYKYHGRAQAFADSARKGGLNF